MSIDRLIEKIKQKDNPTVAGLDPRLEYVPRYLREEAFSRSGKSLGGAAEAIWRFNKGLIDALYDIVPAVKPQLAYYELYGWEGMRAFERTVDYAKKMGLYVIADGKRNDIGSTAAAYAEAYLGETALCENTAEAAFGCDALTVNGFLGTDGITPFLQYGKSIFVLVKTSNPSSGDLQDQALADKTVYEHMAELVNLWGEGQTGGYGYSNVGAVAGATYPKQLSALRRRMPKAYLLVPGYGAQGAGAEDIAGAFNPDGLGAVINSSRGIMCAYQKEKAPEEAFAEAARREAIRMRDEIRRSIA